MVPANADHATGNESQKNTSTLRTFFERLKFWKRDKKEKEEEEPARLTPMPAWLMHWWTPLAIAEGLLRWPLLLAIIRSDETMCHDCRSRSSILGLAAEKPR